MAVTENAGVKLDSSCQNSDKITVSERNPPCPDDDQKNPKPNSSPSTQTTTEVGLESELSHLGFTLSKLNPMAKEFVPRNKNAHVPPRRRIFSQGKQGMTMRTSLAQNANVIRRTVYVNDIDQQVTEEQLASLFLSSGQVVDCRICGEKKSILRFAFIEFADEDGARSALTKSGTLLGSHSIRVLPSKTAIAPVNPSFLPSSEDELLKCVKTIYCTNIEKKVTKTELVDFFERVCGEVQHLRLLGDKRRHTQIALIEFKMAESAIVALNCSGFLLRGLSVRVSPSKTPIRPESSDLT